MALNSTMIRFNIKLSDVDRAIYETLELRVAKHPSESEVFLMARMIAYCLNVEEGIEFSGGIATPDDAAIYVKDLTGQILKWIDIGNPSPKRLHKASKAAKKVIIYTHRDPKILLDEMTGQEIHKKSEIEIFSIPPRFLNPLSETLLKDNKWELLYNEGELAITVNDKTYATDVSQHSLV